MAAARIDGGRRCRRWLVRQCIERDELQNDHEKVGHGHPLRSGNEHHPCIPGSLQTQEPAHGGEEDLRLLAVHPVAGALDRHQLGTREERPHGDGVLRPDIA